MEKGRLVTYRVVVERTFSLGSRVRREGTPLLSGDWSDLGTLRLVVLAGNWL